MSSTCPICKTENAGDGVLQEDNYFYNCPKCGIFSISFEAVSEIENKAPIQKLSSWISEQHEIYKEKLPYIDSTKLDAILNQRDKTIREKFECFMRTMLYIDDMNLKADMFNHCYIKDKDELGQLIEKAIQENYFKKPPKTLEKLVLHVPDPSPYNFYGLTFEGREYIESLNEPNKNSKKIFMAFWFDEAKELQKIFDNIVKPAIDNGGFLAERVSSSTTNPENKISDEIIGMIKSSRAVIADCTGNRTAVYYEAGFARGMKIPVIWTCRKSDFENICFDVSHDPFIVWDDPVDLADKIVKRLKAIL